MELKQEYVGRPADIIIERKGFLGRIFEQTIEASDVSDSVTMDYSLVKRINSAYRRLEKPVSQAL